MKTLSVGLAAMALVALTGCGSGGPGQSGPTADTPVTTTVQKPVVEQAESSFSLKVPFESVAIKQGEGKEVVIGINRGDNFGEEVAIDVTGLPAGVTVDTPNPVIKTGSTDVKLALKAADDAALGDFTINLTGRTASSSADSSNEFKITVAKK